MHLAFHIAFEDRMLSRHVMGDVARSIDQVVSCAHVTLNGHQELRAACVVRAILACVCSAPWHHPAQWRRRMANTGCRVPPEDHGTRVAGEVPTPAVPSDVLAPDPRPEDRAL